MKVKYTHYFQTSLVKIIENRTFFWLLHLECATLPKTSNLLIKKILKTIENLPIKFSIDDLVERLIILEKATTSCREKRL